MSPTPAKGLQRPAVLSAGGTGGHMFPALALGEELARRGRRVVVFTDDRGKTYAEKIAGIRQSTAVVLAVAEAVWAVLDALVSLVRPRGGGGGGVPLRRPGVMVASDVAE